jgi:hypothetical protein
MSIHVNSRRPDANNPLPENGGLSNLGNYVFRRCAVPPFVDPCNAGSGADSTSGEIQWGRGDRLGGRSRQ